MTGRAIPGIGLLRRPRPAGHARHSDPCLPRSRGEAGPAMRSGRPDRWRDNPRRPDAPVRRNRSATSTAAEPSIRMPTPRMTRPTSGARFSAEPVPISSCQPRRANLVVPASSCQPCRASLVVPVSSWRPLRGRARPPGLPRRTRHAPRARPRRPVARPGHRRTVVPSNRPVTFRPAVPWSLSAASTAPTEPTRASHRSVPPARRRFRSPPTRRDLGHSMNVQVRPSCGEDSHTLA